MAVDQTFVVEGMTCNHCVQSVTRAVTALPGVQEVQVDLPTGTVTVTGEGEVPAASVHAAIEEAGFTPISA
jgi:copper ion binding protein